MARELLPVIDLRLLSQAELNTLSLSCPNAFDLRRCDDVVVPKIDRSVFNESAGSRKQTYSRLRLAPRNPSSSSSAAATTSAPASEATGSDDNDRRENDQIVFHLRKLFAREDPSVSVDPPQTLTLDGDSNTGKEEAKPLVVFADRDREMLNARGMEVDLVALGEKVDPFAGELRRMTEGLKSEEELLGFLNALDGQWGSRRRRRKIVEASGFGDHLPRGWKLLLGLKRKEGVTWVNCRRYVSPNGHQFVSCKEISSYIFSLVGPNAATPISVQNDGTTADKLTAGFPAGFYQKNDATKESHHVSSCTPVSSVSHNHDKQIVLYGGEKQQATEVLRNTLDCSKCNQSFGDKDTYLQHQLSFHQKNAKRRRIGKSIGDGVIVKDGKYECQFCHKTFDERHRYNGHIGAHVRYQGLSAEALPAEISAGRIYNNPSPVAAVPCGFQPMAALPEQNEKICSVKSTNELHNIQISEVACTSKLFAENKGHDTTESKSKDVLLVINDGYSSKSEHDNGCDLIDKSSKENFQASSVIDNKSNGCANNSVIDKKSNGRTETIYSPFSDVNNMANKSSADATQVGPVDKSADNQLNDCDMTCSECVDVIEDSNVKDMTSHDGRVNDSVADSKSEEVDKGSNMEDVRPNPFSDTLFFPLRDVISETCQSVTETGQSNLRAKFLDHIGGTNRTCCKSEDFGDSNTSMVLKPDSCIDSVTFKAHSEIDIPSSPMVSDFEEYDKEQTVTMGSHVMDLSGNRYCYESEAHADDVFTSTMAENILVQLDTSISESKADFTHCHSQSEKSSAPEGLAIDGLDAANCITPFVNGHTDGIEPNADCLFDIGMKDSKLEELGKTVAMPENSFDSSNIVCEPVAAGVTCGVNDLRISLQVNSDGLPSWMRTANGIPMVDVMSNQIQVVLIHQDEEIDQTCSHPKLYPFYEQELTFYRSRKFDDEVGCVGQKHHNLPGFEELSLGPASSFEFASLTSEGSIAAAEPTNALGNRSCPTVQLAWEISTPKMLNGCELTSVCVWCSAEFSHDGATAEQQSDSLGFICPACKEKISGQLNILNNGSSV